MTNLLIPYTCLSGYSTFFFFLEIPAGFCWHGSGRKRLGLRPHYWDESLARDVTGFQGEMHLRTPVPRHR